MALACRLEGAVFSIAFDRPQRRNAIDAAMYTQLAEAFEHGETQEAVRVFLLHGTAGTFTAGNDIEDFVERPPLAADTPVFRFLRVMSAARKPIVAAVCGPAIGIGTTMLLHCELVYAAEDARFQLPFTRLGVVPEFASSYLLPRTAGYVRAAEWLLLGEPFGAAEAHAAGLVNRVLPSGEVLAAARGAAERLAALPAASVRTTKALMKDSERGAIAARLEEEGEHFRRMLTEPPAREALSAFLEKRKPDFTGM